MSWFSQVFKAALPTPKNLAAHGRKLFDKDSWEFRDGFGLPPAMTPFGLDPVQKSVESRIYENTGLGPSNKVPWKDTLYKPTGFSGPYSPSNPVMGSSTSSPFMMSTQTTPVVNLSSRRWLY